MTIRDRQDYERRKREAASLGAELARIEQIERSLLAELGYEDSNDVFTMASSQTKPLTPKQRKAYYSMLTLAHLKQLRRHVSDGNAERAAHEALRVGFYGGHVLIHAMDGANREEGRSRAGKTRGAQRTAESKKIRAERQRMADALPPGLSKQSAAIRIAAKLENRSHNTIRQQISTKRRRPS